MKVIRIVFELDFGGVEKVIQLTAAYFQSDPDIQHEVLVLGKGGRVEHQIREQGGMVNVLDANPKIPNIKLVIWLRDYFKKHRPDVVHTVGAEANFHGLWAAWLAGVPLRIGEEIGFPRHHFLYRALFKWTYRFAHQVISVSEAVRDHLVQIGEIKMNQSIVVYNPVALECPDLMPEKADSELHFIMVSRLTAIKNIPAVLKALSEIIKETAFRPQLTIVGDGEEKENYQQKCDSLGISKYVDLVGYHEDVAPFLSRADVFLIPSFSEGSSVALAEAMVMGLPSIITQVGGANEIIGGSASAIEVIPYDYQSIKSAMLSFLKMDPKERKAMGIRAKQEAEKFSVKNYCSQLMELYNSPVFKAG